MADEKPQTTRITPEVAMAMIRDCIGELPRGYRMVQQAHWIRVFAGTRDEDRWDRPGLEFRLDLPKVVSPQLVIRAQIDLPTFLGSNILVTTLIDNLRVYSDLWSRVGAMGQTLEIVLGEET